MIGMMLLMMLSGCKAPTFKNPVEMFAISQKFNTAAVGHKNLNYKLRKSAVGEWVKETEIIPLHEAPNDLMCFSMKTWLKNIKPKLKEASEYYHD